jgi:hypothetical protein
MMVRWKLATLLWLGRGSRELKDYITSIQLYKKVIIMEFKTATN